MIRRATSNRSGMMRFTFVVFLTAALQGCSIINPSTPDATLENPPDPLRMVKKEAPRPITPSTAPSTALVGAASWYGPGFSGKKTASGDIFDETKFTAAHKSLPLGTKAKVTHLSSGKSVEVLVNDRGPYVEGRIIDLSQAAANALGIIDRGVAEVRIELLQETVSAETR
jgi:rare lipoprotein A